MQRISKLTNVLAILGILLLMFGRALTIQDHIVLTTNGRQQIITRAEHPDVFIIATLVCFLGGLVFIGGAFYTHFGLKLSRPPDHRPWGLCWYSIIGIGLALLSMLVALLANHFRH
jgi:H+/Cl- antiporter ClcA